MLPAGIDRLTRHGSSSGRIDLRIRLKMTTQYHEGSKALQDRHFRYHPYINSDYWIASIVVQRISSRVTKHTGYNYISVDRMYWESSARLLLEST
jgi:hypothetical protein